MSGVWFVTAMVLGWALGCCLFYALLRWANVHFGAAVRTSGAWALVLWILVYMGLGVSRSLGFEAEVLYPATLFWGILAAFGGAFLVGGLLMRWLPRRSELWWHDVLFCALYFGGAFVWGRALLVCWPTDGGPLYEIARWNGEVYQSHWLMLCAWLFPLGAPLAELLGRSVLRLHREIAGLG